MHEVEVKASLTDKETFIKNLAERGCQLGSEIVQEDVVYVRELGTIEQYLGNADFLRLRTEGTGRTLFTFKHHIGRNTNLYSAPLEHELEVSSLETMEKILLLMGYQEAVRIKKTRRKGKCDNWEICVDEVENLGCFVELEQLVDVHEGVPEIQERMVNFLVGLGVDPGNRLNDRYDVLILEQHLNAKTALR